MPKVSTKANSKNKKTSEPMLPPEAEPVWEQDEVLTASPKQFSESLKRISEQAKDWEEMRRPPQREFHAAPVQEAILPRNTSRANTNWPKIGTAIGVLLIIFLALHSALLTWQTLTLTRQTLALTRSMAELNSSIIILKDKVDFWSDAETAAQR